MKDSYTGTCPICYRAFSDCECRVTVETEGFDEIRREELWDLLHTIDMHCQIGKLIIEQGLDSLLPSILEDIFYFAQDLPEHFVKEEEEIIHEEELVDDGFGTAASAVCPTCGERAVYIVRPGDIRCANCEMIAFEKRERRANDQMETR